MNLRYAWVWALLAACGDGPTPPKPEAPADRVASTPQEGKVPTKAPAAAREEEPARRPPARKADVPELEPGQRYTTLLVVLGGVGSHYVQPCDEEVVASLRKGRALSVTPFLQRLVDDHGAALTCDAYAPSSWALPSFKSLMRGRNLYLPPDAAPPRPPLVEAMKARGYETALVSASPAIRASGAERGFDQVRVSPDDRSMKYPKMAEVVEQVVSRTDPAKPLFLVLDLVDAESPYPPVRHKSWGLAQGWTTLFDAEGKPTELWRRYYAERLAIDEEQRFLLRLEQGVIRGAELSDDNLKDILEVLKRQGRPFENLRMVVVGGHGSFVGEHRLIGETAGTWEPGVRVPLLYVDTTTDDRPALRGPMSTVDAYDLLLDGELSANRPTVLSASRALKADAPFGRTMVSAWVPGRPKLTWDEGDLVTYDLAGDPNETSPRRGTGHPAEALVRQVADAISRKDAKE